MECLNKYVVVNVWFYVVYVCIDVIGFGLLIYVKEMVDN